MPVSRLQSAITRALTNSTHTQQTTGKDVLSSKDLKRIMSAAKEDGVSEADAKLIVSEIAQALKDDKLEVDTSGRRNRINSFFDNLSTHQSLGVDTSNHTDTNGTVNWIGALMANASGTTPTPTPTPTPDPVVPTPDPTPTPDPVTPDPVTPTPTPTTPSVDLGKPSFTGEAMKVGADGITLGGDKLALDLKATTQKDLDGVMGLLVPGQLDGLDAAAKTQLATTLVDAVAGGMPVDNAAKGMFKNVAATAASLGAVLQMAENAPTQKLLDMFDKLPNPMSKSLVHAALQKQADAGSLDAAQTAAFGKLEVPENKDLLVKAYTDMASGQTDISWKTPKGEARQFALSGLAFAKKQTSIDNFFDGMKTFKDLNSDYSNPWDAEEVNVLKNTLETYCEKHQGTAYVFGTFSTDAPKNVAGILNQRVQAKLLPNLDSATPNFSGVPLTTEQAGALKSIITGIKDDSGVRQLTDAMKDMNAAFTGQMSRYGGAPTPTEPLPTAAFAAFSRIAGRHLAGKAETADGMMDTRKLSREVSDLASDLGASLRPHLSSLAQTPPSMGGVTVDADGAKALKGLLQNHTKSTVTADNLTTALNVFAQHNGGKVDGQAMSQFLGMVDNYKADFAPAQFLDFNKLGRVAEFVATGKPVPMSKVNGKDVSMAGYYGAVGEAVSASINKSGLRHEWMADRWGHRARNAAENLDALVQAGAENKGPLHALKQKFPGQEIMIKATGRDGEHEQFLFCVKGPGGRIDKTYALDGEMNLVAFNKPRSSEEPVLFRASIADDGSVDVKVPDERVVRKYPLQTPYSMGDSVDVPFFDSSVTEDWNEGEKFNTQHKVLEGKITGFDGKGGYEVTFKKPDGTEDKKSMSMRDIKKYNNPHFFAERGSYFSDVNIDIKSDKALNDFLVSCDPLIEKHFPKDGSTAKLSPQQLAKKQKAFIDDAMEFIRDAMKYPTSKNSNPDEASKTYHSLVDGYGRFDLGKLVKIKKGVCRHQCILEHLVMQRAGIDSRLASGSANTGSGNYRGLHIWMEVALADNSRYLSDQTWNDATIPLWDGAYDSDQRRVEMYHRTARYDSRIVD